MHEYWLSRVSLTRGTTSLSQSIRGTRGYRGIALAEPLALDLEEACSVGAQLDSARY